MEFKFVAFFSHNLGHSLCIYSFNKHTTVAGPRDLAVKSRDLNDIYIL